MTLELLKETDGKIVTVRLTGKLLKDDYKIFLPAVDKAVEAHGKVRILVEMNDFHGWSAGAAWEDIKFDMKHFNHIERLAMVGEKKWEEWLATLGKPFTTGTIRYFPRERLAQARAWVAEA